MFDHSLIDKCRKRLQSTDAFPEIYTKVKPEEGIANLEAELKTGRTHQIRVHLLHEGHAIAGDDKYGDFAANRALARGESVPGVRFDRMFLHARSLRFAHPLSGETIELQAALPSECLGLLQQLALCERQSQSTPKAP